jgi:hypothetical protein
VLLATSRDFLQAPIFEEGDAALNALQIDRAKELREIYGNYSRFHFNHPGPAFFYVYAAGEWLFTDQLQALSPNCAHTVVSTVLQVGFFSLAVYLVGLRFRNPFFLPMALLVAALHFAKVGQAFNSIWPPHVLLMPFLAFWAACVSVASGRIQHLPWLALCGCFLVHGHVAQPLFVVTMTVAAYALWWLLARTRDTSEETPKTPVPAHLLAGLIIVIFLVPIAIDVSRGEQSNFHAILRHLNTGGEHKKLEKSAAYFLSFFSYTRNQDELFHTLSRESLVFVKENMLTYVLWSVGLLFVALTCWRGFGLTPERLRFVRIASGGWLLTVLLCFVWGMMQTGPMWDYNGYFYYGVNYALLLIVAGVVTSWIPERIAAVLGIGATIAAAAVFWKDYRLTIPPFRDSGAHIKQDTLRAIKADPQPDAPKLLVFEHNDWPKIASVALTLQRERVPFLVDPSWTFMFQKEHELTAKAAADNNTKLSIWRFVHRKDIAGTDVGRKMRVMFAPQPLSPSNGLIDFSANGNFELYQVFGFSTPLPGDYAPTAQNDAILQFVPTPTEEDVEIEIAAEPFFAPGQPHIQPCELRFNGELVFAAPFTEPGVLRARILKEQWNKLPVAIVHLTLPDAQSMADLGISGDPRRLGLAVKKLTTHLSTTPRG